MGEDKPAGPHCEAPEVESGKHQWNYTASEGRGGGRGGGRREGRREEWWEGRRKGRRRRFRDPEGKHHPGKAEQRKKNQNQKGRRPHLQPSIRLEWQFPN